MVLVLVLALDPVTTVRVMLASRPANPHVGAVAGLMTALHPCTGGRMPKLLHRRRSSMRC